MFAGLRLFCCGLGVFVGLTARGCLSVSCEICCGSPDANCFPIFVHGAGVISQTSSHSLSVWSRASAGCVQARVQSAQAASRRSLGTAPFRRLRSWQHEQHEQHGKEARA
jgi:hypothetical protein